MNTQRTLLALALLATITAAQAGSPATTGALPTPANRIVGVWEAVITAGPCGSPNLSTFRGIQTFHAGGTLNDDNTFPPALRAGGHGIWQYQGHGNYAVRFKFFRFTADGSFDGTQDVEAQITLTQAGTHWQETVYSRWINPDGSVRVAICGGSQAERLSL